MGDCVCCSCRCLVIIMRFQSDSWCRSRSFCSCVEVCEQRKLARLILPACLEWLSLSVDSRVVPMIFPQSVWYNLSKCVTTLQRFHTTWRNRYKKVSAPEKGVIRFSHNEMWINPADNWICTKRRESAQQLCKGKWKLTTSHDRKEKENIKTVLQQLLAVQGKPASAKKKSKKIKSEWWKTVSNRLVCTKNAFYHQNPVQV